MMDGSGFCGFCDEPVEELELLMHITQHGLRMDAWPDGTPINFRIPAPAEFIVDGA